jgi:hypothetical protein
MLTGRWWVRVGVSLGVLAMLIAWASLLAGERSRAIIYGLVAAALFGEALVKRRMRKRN